MDTEALMQAREFRRYAMTSLAEAEATLQEARWYHREIEQSYHRTRRLLAIISVLAAFAAALFIGVLLR